jgi:glycosyltransferase involved in cell wall biosynthesis
VRILHFFKTALPDTVGGIEQVIHQVAKGAKNLGIETDVLSLTSARLPRITQADGYTLHRARMDLYLASTGISASAFLRFRQLAQQADVIHYHFPWPFMDLVHFANRLNKPTVVTYHSDIVRQKYLLKLYSPLMRKFLSSVDHIIVTSPNYLATSEVLKKFTNKVSVIPIGLDKADYAKPKLSRLQFWSEKVGSKFYLFVGVLRYYKGLHILMEAAVSTTFPIVIVGAGPVEQELKNQARRLGLKNIFFLGQVNEEDKVALLTLCYGVVFPSHLRSEAFGISLLEGAMFGKPLISSEIGTGTSFINIENETGIVVPPNNPTALREAMISLWSDSKKADAMGKHAEQRYWEYFTAEKMINSYAEVYKALSLKKSI